MPTPLDRPSVPATAIPATRPSRWTGSTSRSRDRLDARSPAPLLALRLQGLDTVSHYYLRQAMPRAFGDVSDEERRRYGQVLEQYYRFVDAEIGRLLDRLGPDDLLLVVSPFGMEPLSPAKRLLEHALGNAALSGSHERAPDGFLMAFGGPVEPGRLPRGVGGRRHADGAVFPGASRRPRHGRLRAHRPVHPRIHRHAPHRLHSDLRA